ncbi:MAG: DUF2061 domain-containing protein [Rickettsiales bacterium]
MAEFIRSHATVAKTITYSMTHVTVAVSVAYALSGSLAVALSIGLIEPMVQTFTFYFHERGWKKFLKV